MGEFGDYEDKDDIKEHLKDASKTMRASMGFRVRVTADELRIHLLARAEHHRAWAEKVAENRSIREPAGAGASTIDALDAENRREVQQHRAASSAFAFCSTHLAEDSYDLTLAEASQLEIVDPDARYPWVA